MATVRQKHPDRQDEKIVEKGDIYFFYRPRSRRRRLRG